jgi:Rrf2 family iron-sulfur cluster assembly transcriptional regulator
MPNRQLDVAFQSLCALAAMPSHEALPLSVLAPRLGVSLSYLEALFMALRAARLVDSQRGPGGGYRLAVDPAELPLAEVARALGLHTLTGQREPRPEPPDTVEHAATERLWDALERHALQVLAPRCLADLMPEYATA